MNEPKSVWNVGATLGEGPVWFEGALWFVDIKQRKVHCYRPGEGGTSWDAPEQIGFLYPMRSGSFVAGLQSGLHRFDPGSGSFELILEVEPDRPANRLNDGVVDSVGRLWFGTMADGEREKSGAFYRFEQGQLHETGLKNISITNGPAVSPDGRTIYWVDTRGGGIFACAIAADGSLGESREFVRIDPAEGHPDGPTVDSQGHVWISLYAGWHARRYSPDGRLVEQVRFPVANITKIAFGGADLRTAYATTARHLLSAKDIERQPGAGNLFEFRVEAPGLPCPLVGA